MTFLYSFGHCKTFLHKVSNLVVRIFIYLRRISIISKFQKIWYTFCPNTGKFGKILLLCKCPKRVCWPFLALQLSSSPQKAPKTNFGWLERVYQASRPGRANKPLIWAFAVKRMTLYYIVNVK